MKLTDEQRAEIAEKAKNNKSGRYVVIVVAIVLFSLLIYKISAPSEMTKQEKIEALFSKLDGKNETLVEYVKTRLDDPNSFEHVSTKFAEKGDSLISIKMEYRAKNQFNAVITSTVVATSTLDGDIIDASGI